MATQNLSSVGRKPESVELLVLHVLGSERVTPHLQRVTFGGGDIERFGAMGFDQWFRLFIPVSEQGLARVPKKMSLLSYTRFMTVSKADRPIMRNYTARAYRPDGPGGPELDIDFVVHGSAEDGTAGPAATWSTTCVSGDTVGILDEGIGFNPPEHLQGAPVVLVADESGLPALAAVLSSLPTDATGHAYVEVPGPEDQQDLAHPAGVEITWVARQDPDAVPGRAVLATVLTAPVPDTFYGWVVGESALPVAVRRHWTAAGVPKENIMFCGYWRAGKSH